MKKIKQLFCKHKYEWYVKKTGVFASLRGETRVLMCSKCEKIKSEYLVEYEGMGFK